MARSTSTTEGRADAEWMLIFVLPNLSLTAAIEAGCAAIVPATDSRVKAAVEANAAARALFLSFTDQFGKPISPAALLVDRAAPASVRTHEALADFRNLAAISSLVTAWQNFALGYSLPGTLFSDSFDFYPYVPTRDSRLMGRSIALTMRNEAPGAFHGQQAAHMLRPGATFAVDPDEVVFAACMREWRRKYVTNRTRWRQRALFRSLEMAAHATRVPAVGTREPSIHDFGTSLALWVSAFEILKPTRVARSSLSSVMDLLGLWPWRDLKLRSRRYLVGKKGSHRVCLAQKAYAELYRARCDFLHGNPVTVKNLLAEKQRDGPGLMGVAPLLYRTALGAYLSPPLMSTREQVRLLLRAMGERQFEAGVLRALGRYGRQPP